MQKLRVAVEQTNEHFDSFMKAKLPTNAICSALECCENLFLQSFTKRMHLKFIHSNMLKLMLENMTCLGLTKKIVESFVRLRIVSAVKFLNSFAKPSSPSEAK